MSDPTLCIYHGNCADGFGAAWAVWKKYGNNIQYHAGHYGKDAPDVTDQHVLLVDFSYKAPVLAELVTKAASITILDHHKTAEADITPFLERGEVSGLFDMTKSGAVLTWEYIHPNESIPQLLLHVQDRDLWQFKLPGTREIQACVSSHEYDFNEWSILVDRVEDPLEAATVVAEGIALERKHQKDLRELLKATTRSMNIGGVVVPVANLPYMFASDAAGELAKTAPFAATYFDGTDKRAFSLRSRPDGADVSEIAARYGGGGHKHASGFAMPIGWEGEAGL